MPLPLGLSASFLKGLQVAVQRLRVTVFKVIKAQGQFLPLLPDKCVGMSLRVMFSGGSRALVLQLIV